MARYFMGESPVDRFSQSRRQGEGQGRRREAGSEGSPIRNDGAMYKTKSSGTILNSRRLAPKGVRRMDAPNIPDMRRYASWDQRAREHEVVHSRLGCIL